LRRCAVSNPDKLSAEPTMQTMSMGAIFIAVPTPARTYLNPLRWLAGCNEIVGGNLYESETIHPFSRHVVGRRYWFGCGVVCRLRRRGMVPIREAEANDRR